jgi:hypothetical protein
MEDEHGWTIARGDRRAQGSKDERQAIACKDEQTL